MKQEQKRQNVRTISFASTRQGTASERFVLREVDAPEAEIVFWKL
jgi:hypothetical protein